MKSKKGRLLIRAGLLLIAAAAVLTAYNFLESYRAGQAAQKAVFFLTGEKPQEALADLSGDSGEATTGFSVPVLIPPEATEAAATPEPVQETAAPSEQTPAPKVTPLPPVEIPDYILNPKMEMPVVSYGGQDYIGVLMIPVLELEIPVISEWSYPRLKLSPCRYVGSAYTNDMVISAHNYQSHFGRINELKPGNTVLFTDVDGNVFKYEVVLKETLNPTDVEEMANGEFDLTLFTCTVGGSYRVTVRCDLAYGYPRYMD